MEFLEAQWKEWSEKNDIESVEEVTDEQIKELLIKDLTVASQMTVEEYTLFQKWSEVHEKYPTQVSPLFGDTYLEDNNQKVMIQKCRDNIWIPEHIDDYLKLKPVMTYTKDMNLSETWNTVRTFTSTMKNNSNIGRNLNYLVTDDVTGKYLGVICISSDFLDLTPRDNHIGWERKKKTQGKMINYTAIGSTIVPLQPLGYNYVGGKLLALLCLSDEVQYQWKKQYGDVLVGVTTTSLYGKNKAGGLSQYDGLKHWKKMGFSSGSVSYDSTRSTANMLKKWMMKNHTRKYFEWWVAKKPCGKPYLRDHKNRSNHWAYARLGIPKELIRCEHQRGIYFSELYTNSKEFLRGEIGEEGLTKAFDTSYEYLGNLWKEKYASKRIRSLKEQGRVSTETLFYDDLIYLDWEAAKEKYLAQVGR